VVEAQRKALDMARESLPIAQVSYENGLITSIELSDARQALLQTEWNLAQAKVRADSRCRQDAIRGWSLLVPLRT
jgi:outer membrane protein TolC